MSAFLSDEFSHLVGRAEPGNDERNFAILKAILSSEGVTYPGCIPGQSQSSVTVFPNRRSSDGDMIVPTCTCYCDIPLVELAFHAVKYGRFGLSFHRDFLIDRGARPVLYVPTRKDDHRGVRGKTLLSDWQATYSAFNARFVDPIRKRTQSERRTLGRAPKSDDGIVGALNSLLLNGFLAFVKPYDSELDPKHVDYYYAEREWRITNYLRFMPDDVAHVFAPRDYAEPLLAAFPGYSGKVMAIE